MIFLIIYIVGMVAVALYMDSPTSYCDTYTFSERLSLMLSWPLFLIAGVIIEIICWIPYQWEIYRADREEKGS